MSFDITQLPPDVIRALALEGSKMAYEAVVTSAREELARLQTKHATLRETPISIPDAAKRYGFKLTTLQTVVQQGFIRTLTPGDNGRGNAKQISEGDLLVFIALRESFQDYVKPGSPFIKRVYTEQLATVAA